MKRQLVGVAGGLPLQSLYLVVLLHEVITLYGISFFFFHVCFF